MPREIISEPSAASGKAGKPRYRGIIRLYPELARVPEVSERDRLARKYLRRYLIIAFPPTMVLAGPVNTLLLMPLVRQLTGVSPNLCVILPAILIGLVCGFGIRWLVHKPTQRALRRYLNEHGLPTCMQCGYDTRDLPEPRCPECGRGL